MEHRLYPRKVVDCSIQLSSKDGRTCQARMIDISRFGKRVIVEGNWPSRNAVVVAKALDSDPEPVFLNEFRMFVVHSQGRELGLSLVEDNVRIDIQ